MICYWTGLQATAKGKNEFERKNKIVHSALVQATMDGTAIIYKDEAQEGKQGQRSFFGIEEAI